MAHPPHIDPTPDDEAADKALRDRLAALDTKMLKPAAHAQAEPDKAGFSGVSVSPTNLRASRVGTELLVGICAGLGLGWLLDNALATRPLFMLLLAFLGFGAGLWNAWKMIRGVGAKVGFKEDEK